MNFDQQRAIATRAQIQASAAQVMTLTSDLRAEIFRLFALSTSSHAEPDAVDWRPIAENFELLSALVEESAQFRRIREEDKKFLGRKCSMCKAEVVDVERGAGDQIVKVCADGHRDLASRFDE